MRIKLVIADDHPVIINGLKTVLHEHDEILIVAEVNNGIELIKFIEDNSADVVLMDVNMPEMNGIEACKHLTENQSDIKVLAFSQYKESRFVKRILKCGAKGYLLKDSPVGEIIQAIKEVYSGGTYLSNGIAELLVGNEKKKTDMLFPHLSKRESEVLKLICNGRTTTEISNTLFISYHTVETHRANLLLKVGAKNTAELVKWAVENELI